VLRHVLGQLAGVPSERDDLVARCCGARRELTAGPVAVVDVMTSQGIERIRVTRGEFEETIRESVSITTLNIRRALGEAAEKGASTYDVLIVGDGADVPLLSQMLSSEVGFGPVVEVGRSTAATGAALMAGDRAEAARRARRRTVAPAPPAAPTSNPPTSTPRSPAPPPSMPPAATAADPVRAPSSRPPAWTPVQPRSPVRPEPAAYQVPVPAEVRRNDWPAPPAQRSGGRVRTAIVAAAAGLSVLLGGVAATSAGGHGGGGYHSHF